MKRCLVWIDFLICLVLGRLGIHKLLQGKYFAFALYFLTSGFFYIGWAIDSVWYLFCAILGRRNLTWQLSSVERKKTEKVVKIEKVVHDDKNDMSLKRQRRAIDKAKAEEEEFDTEVIVEIKEKDLKLPYYEKPSYVVLILLIGCLLLAPHEMVHDRVTHRSIDNFRYTVTEEFKDTKPMEAIEKIISYEVDDFVTIGKNLAINIYDGFKDKETPNINLLKQN